MLVLTFSQNKLNFEEFSTSLHVSYLTCAMTWKCSHFSIYMFRINGQVIEYYLVSFILYCT